MSDARPARLKCECGKCRTCYQREYGRGYRERNRERVRQLDAESYQRHAAERCAKIAQNRLDDPEKYRERDRLYRKNRQNNSTRDPAKHAVHTSVHKAIASGRLIPQPCEECGESPVTSDGKRGVHAHHENYDERLLVRWLCFRCHRKAHRKYVYPRSEHERGRDQDDHRIV